MIASWVLAAVAVTIPGEVTTEFVAEGVTARVGGYRPIRAEMKDEIEGVKAAPEGLSAPKYGTLQLGDKKWLFILDEPDGKPAKLYIDTNGDGDLTNDPETAWAANPQGGLTMHRGSGKVDLGNGQIGSLGLYRFDPKDPRRASLANMILFYTDFGSASNWMESPLKRSFPERQPKECRCGLTVIRMEFEVRSAKWWRSGSLSILLAPVTF